jgi:hypothetical protein
MTLEKRYAVPVRERDSREDEIYLLRLILKSDADPLT